MSGWQRVERAVSSSSMKGQVQPRRSWHRTGDLDWSLGVFGEWSLISNPHLLSFSSPGTFLSFIWISQFIYAPLSRLFLVHPGSEGSNQDPEVRGRENWRLGFWSSGDVSYSKLLIYDLRWRMTKSDLDKEANKQTCPFSHVRRDLVSLDICRTCSSYLLLERIALADLQARDIKFEVFIIWLIFNKALRLQSMCRWGKESLGHSDI